MIIVKNLEEIAKMKEVGRVAAIICDQIIANIYPGITTGEINKLSAKLMKEYKVESAFLGYRGFPATVCVSVNEEVVHGIPGSRRIAIGDIVSVDLGVILDGFYGDLARTTMVGVSDPEVRRLVMTTEKALEAGMARACAGNHLSDVSHAIEQVAIQAGFSVVRDFVGHGIGKQMHEDPQIPNFGQPGQGPKLKEGMTLAIEPMVNMGASGVEVLADGWTVATSDRKPSAHFEHTIAVTSALAEILTRAN